MEKAMELIEQLAAKLGVAVEYLWTLLVKQQYAEAGVDLVIATFGIIVMILVAEYAPKLRAKAHAEYTRLRTEREAERGRYFSISSYEEDRWEERYNNIPIFAIVIFATMFLITFILAVCGIQQLINPEYYALKEILYTIQSAQ